MDRPRFDALLEGIKLGNWDAELKELEEAIRDRQRVRREAVLEQVEEVFGPNYQVVAHRDRDFINGSGQTGVVR